jgi:hypothetical protein
MTPGSPPSRRPRPSSSPGKLVELSSIETPPELVLFNAYLAAEKDRERERQRIRQAEIVKDKAAARLKELGGGRASREEVAAAEAEYREAVAALRRVEAGEPADAGDEPDDALATGDATPGDAEPGETSDAANDDTAGRDEADTAGGTGGDDAPGGTDGDPDADVVAETDADPDAGTATAASAEADAEADAEAAGSAEADIEADAEADADATDDEG